VISIRIYSIRIYSIKIYSIKIYSSSGRAMMMPQRHHRLGRRRRGVGGRGGARDGGQRPKQHAQVPRRHLWGGRVGGKGAAAAAAARGREREEKRNGEQTAEGTGGVEIDGEY
jgi:hypothetical protein